MTIGNSNLSARYKPVNLSDFVAHINRKLSETFSVDVGQVIVGVGLPFVTRELGNHLKAVMSIVSVITR